jgi:hypothetical protein
MGTNNVMKRKRRFFVGDIGCADVEIGFFKVALKKEKHA